MDEWWAALSQLEQVYWATAFISGILFIVVLIGTILGSGGDSDMDHVDMDMDADGGIGFQFLTFKNLVGFFTVFAWAGLASINAGMSNTATILISLGCGFAMMMLMAWTFLWMSKQAESGTLQIKNAINQVGEVYLTIGKERSSLGKIQIKVQGSFRELDAVTDELEDLTQGDVIKVAAVVSGELLLVEKLKK
jgi:hypothetical protein